MSSTSPLCTRSEINCNALGTAAISLAISSAAGACTAYLLSIPAAAGGIFGLTAAATIAILDWTFGQSDATAAKVAQMIIKFLVAMVVATTVTVLCGFTLPFSTGIVLALATATLNAGMIYLIRSIKI